MDVQSRRCLVRLRKNALEGLWRSEEEDATLCVVGMMIWTHREAPPFCFRDQGLSWVLDGRGMRNNQQGMGKNKDRACVGRNAQGQEREKKEVRVSEARERKASMPICPSHQLTGPVHTKSSRNFPISRSLAATFLFFFSRLRFFHSVPFLLHNTPHERWRWFSLQNIAESLIFSGYQEHMIDANSTHLPGIPWPQAQSC
jgi:hypothetical protein